MRRGAIIGGVFALVLVLVALAVGYRLVQRDVDLAPASAPAILPPGTATHPPPQTHQGFLYGRITTVGGDTFEGRLRWGGNEEAFWSDFFNGRKNDNPWGALVSPEQLAERRPVTLFGTKIADRKRTIDLDRPFMVRFGDLTRIDALDRIVRVTLKSGTVVDLDRMAADDLADGVRVWDDTRGTVDLHERQIRAIELLPTPALEAVPYRVHGTVRTRQGAFTGFVQWNRAACVGSDTLDGRTPDGALEVRFDTIRSIAREASGGARVTLLDGREIVLAGTADVGPDNRGIDVDDPRYGRVRVSWDAFERVDLGPGGSGPAYDDYPPGSPLAGEVTTRAGRRLAGRLVFDLDESETSETLDAPSDGLDYTIPFGRIASIVPPDPEGGDDDRRALVRLHDGEELRLELAGDLGEGNAGMLVFVDGRERPDYVPWNEVAEVRLERHPGTEP